MRFAAIGAMIGFAVALWGWGQAFRRLFAVPRSSWPVTTALGLAAVVFLGGILNAVSIAYSPVLIGVVAVGLALAAFNLRSRAAKLHWPSPAWIATIVVALPVLAFTIATQMPPAAYNVYDDFEKYFAHAARMVQTGTVAGSALDSMGLETLGAQAFLHGFVLTAFPFSYLNMADAVFGLFLCLMLAGRFAGEKAWVMAGLCVLATAFINPQYANVSSLYLAAALMMAAVALTADASERPKAAALGVIYAALVAMKPTFLLFVALHLGFVAAVRAFERRATGKTLVWVGVVLGCFAAFLLPWIVVNGANYMSVLTEGAPAIVTQARPDTLDLFSPVMDVFGVVRLSYTSVILVIAVAGAAVAWFGKDRRLALTTAAAALILLVGFFFMLVVMGPRLGGYGTSLRYYTPFVIALVPAVCGLFAQLAERVLPHRPWRIALPVILTIVPIGAFATSFADRAQQAWTYGSILSFKATAIEPIWFQYNDFVLNGAMKDQVRAQQDQVPSGEPIAAWINAPFYLDFRRNPIDDVNIAGLSAPWADAPSTGYIIWEYRGIASPKFPAQEKDIYALGAHEWVIQSKALDFAHRLEAIAGSGGQISDDGRFAVFHPTNY